MHLVYLLIVLRRGASMALHPALALPISILLIWVLPLAHCPRISSTILPQQSLPPGWLSQPTYGWAVVRLRDGQWTEVSYKLGSVLCKTMLVQQDGQ